MQVGWGKYSRYQGFFLGGKFLHLTQNQDFNSISKALKSLTCRLRDADKVTVYVWASLYCCGLRINDSHAKVLVSFVHMLHLPDLTTEDMKLGNDLDVW